MVGTWVGSSVMAGIAGCVATAMTAHWRATANLALLCQAYGCGKSVLVPGYGAALLDRVLGFLLGDAEVGPPPFLPSPVSDEESRKEGTTAQEIKCTD